MIKHVAMTAIMAALCLPACNGGQEYTPTPKRHAYPRIALLPQEYIAADSLPLHFEVNSHALTHIEAKEHGAWLTIGYPKYNSNVYITLTPVTDGNIQKIINNRLERISLNTGNGHTSTTYIESKDGFSGQIIYSMPGEALPIQFLVSDGSRWVVSGVVEMANRQADADSVSPITDALRQDIEHSLSTISHNGNHKPAAR